MIAIKGIYPERSEDAPFIGALVCADNCHFNCKNCINDELKYSKSFYIEDKDIIKLDKTLSLEIFHTPGHSTGSISYFLDKDKALFCGDAILSSGQMPIFEDLQNCKNSIKKLVSINKIDILLSSWDVPHKDGQIFDIMQDSLKYLTEIDRAIKEVAIKQKQLDSMEFCKQVIDKLSLPNVMLNPLVARSFQLALNKNRIKL
ncbi:MAG: MBL fold metallo-hydrolase [Endomicrobiia bacterium]